MACQESTAQLHPIVYTSLENKTVDCLFYIFISQSHVFCFFFFVPERCLLKFNPKRRSFVETINRDCLFHQIAPLTCRYLHSHGFVISIIHSWQINIGQPTSHGDSQKPITRFHYSVHSDFRHCLTALRDQQFFVCISLIIQCTSSYI